MIISGTGHRPDKLGGYSQESFLKLVSVAEEALRELKPHRVISGGALGWDQALAAAAKRLDIPYTMALPFLHFESKWPWSSQQYLHHLCSCADRVHYVCDEGYAAWKMQERNEWMVNNSDQVLALWNGTSGGTANCIRYAEKINKPIVNLWDAYQAYLQRDRL